MRWMIFAVLAGCIHSGPDNPWTSDWSFDMQSAVVASTQPSGEQWDPDGSPPDPFVIISINGVAFDRSPTDDQTYTPEWNWTSKSTRISQTDVIKFEMQDSDDFTNDIIMDCDVNPIDAAQVPNTTLQCGPLNFSVSY